MKAIIGMFGGAMALAAVVGTAAPSAADPSIAGESLFTVSHGQPFCTSRGELHALLRAQISHAPIDYGSFPTCRYVADNAIVAVGDDLAPRGRYMHVVRARANVGFGAIDGYTFSVGLYPLPVRQPPFEFRLD